MNNIYIYIYIYIYIIYLPEVCKSLPIHDRIENTRINQNSVCRRNRLFTLRWKLADWSNFANRCWSRGTQLPASANRWRERAVTQNTALVEHREIINSQFTFINYIFILSPGFFEKPRHKDPWECR